MHNVERWRRIDTLYQAALELNEAERAAFLDHECADDAALRQEVASLLASHEEAGSFLVAPAMQVAAKAIASEQDDVIAGGAVGPYKIIRLLGRGGMGEVYLAQDTRLGRHVALKLLPAYFTREEGRLRRFQLEARAASALNHPNVITIFEVGEADAIHFIATEFIEGETLRQRMKRQPVGVSEALAIAVQIASALDVAHQAGIVHRDIKPENLMLRPDSIIKVLDFGLAKLAEQPGVSADASALWNSTDPGTVMGTASYMSPEQARGLKVDARTDLFSLGVVLYEMVSGHTPFQGATTSDVIAAILTQEPLPLANDLSPAPEMLRRIVAKALVKEREARYQTASELLADLKKLKTQMDFGLQSPSTLPLARDVGVTTAAHTVIDTGGHRLDATTDASLARSGTSSGAITATVKPRKRIVALMVLLAVAAITLAAYWLIYRGRSGDQAAPFATFKVSRLTTTGRASFAAVSPDGKYAVHVMGSAGQPSLWLRHIPTGSDKEILPAIQGTLSGLTFSKDGSYIYYDQFTKDEVILYRVPVLGGVAQKLVSDIDTAVSFSPDGARMAYIRGLPIENQAALLIANTDGSGEQRLASFPIQLAYPTLVSSMMQTWGPAWSSDGETIVMGLRDSDPTNYNWNLIAVSIKDGSTRQLTSQRWSSVGQIAWLKDGKGLIVAAAEHPIYSPHQLWHISYPDGVVRKITNDLNNYVGASLTADGDSLITVQSEQLSNVWAASDGDWSRAARVTSNNHDGVFGVAWTPDGRILYTSIATGRREIWTANADGSGQKQVTPDPGLEGRPVTTPDGRYIVFVSNSTGTSHIWRCDMNGGNLKQLTNGAGDSSPSCSPDSRWVYYSSMLTPPRRQVLKVPIDGGESVPLNDMTCSRPVVSPDGRQIAVTFIDEKATPKRYRVALLSVASGEVTKVFDMPLPPQQVMRWTADGQALTYLDTRAGVTNIWALPLDGSAAKPLTDFKSDLIFFYDWSRDGKKLAYAHGLVTDDAVLITNSK
ncbi:MAG: protein kinase domain-containing protein [Blastocatellia bacterium]